MGSDTVIELSKELGNLESIDVEKCPLFRKSRQSDKKEQKE